MAALINDIDDLLVVGLRKLVVDKKSDERPKDKDKTQPELKPKKNLTAYPPKDKEKTQPELKPKKNLTPYQGDLRTFGYFRCENCQNDWSSAHSWADTAQKCEICKKFRFPYRQIPVFGKFRGGRSSRKPHIEPSCGKCLQIKDSCIKIKKCDERPESKQGPIVGLAEATENVKPKPPKRKRNRKSKKN